MRKFDAENHAVCRWGFRLWLELEEYGTTYAQGLAISAILYVAAVVVLSA